MHRLYRPQPGHACSPAEAGAHGLVPMGKGEDLVAGTIARRGLRRSRFTP